MKSVMITFIGVFVKEVDLGNTSGQIGEINLTFSEHLLIECISEE